jgi:hypothetical protein
MRLAVLITTVSLLLLGTAAVASAQTAGLEIVEPETVAFTASDGSTKATSVWVKNSTSNSVTPTFDVVAEDGDGDPIDGLSVQVEGSTAVGAGRVGRIRLSVDGVDSGTKGTGQLVARAEGVAPGSIPASISPEPTILAGADDPLWIPLIMVFGVFALALARANGITNIGNPIPTVGFDFAKSFATSLTTVGAVFGTVLAAKVLPGETTTLSKEAFTALNVLFAVSVVVAGIVPAVSHKDDGTSTLVGLFWVGALITVWAVMGELITLWMLVGELGAQQGFSDAALTTFRAMLLVAALSVLIYATVRIARVTKASGDPGRSAFFAQLAGQARTPML